jgi:cell volume regulation protein A
LRSLLELESGSNDPMAVFLTVVLIGLLVDPQMSAAWLPILFVRQMTLGGLVGYGMGRTLSAAVNRLRLEYEGLYPALTIALVVLTYALTDLIGGNGFLAVYVAGIVMRRAEFIHKRSLIRFHDGIAWLMQIVMFLTLGLQVFPSRLPAVAASGFAIAIFLMLIGRPVAVFLTLAMSHIRFRERALIAWVGLRGAAPIILATFPLVAGVERAGQIFSVVFFIVFTSALIQGTSVPWMANLLGLSLPETAPSRDPLDVISTANRELLEFQIQAASRFAGQRVLDLGLPGGVLMVLIERQGVAIVPSGSTVVLEGDKLLFLTGPNEASAVRSLFQA